MVAKVNSALAIATVMSDVFDNISNVGRNAAKVICDAVQKLYRGKEISKEDQDSIVNELATLQGWNERTSRVRKSEARAILQTYRELPKAAEAAAKKEHGGYHSMIKLARELRDGKNQGDAIAALDVKKKLSKKARAKMLCRQLINKRLGMSAAFVRAIEKACEAEGVNLE